MKNYLDLMTQVLLDGVKRTDRTGTGTISLFGTMLKFNLRDGFPLVTTRKIYFKNITAELAGFLEASVSLGRFQELGTNIWNANVAAWGEDDYMGRIYGVQWREWWDAYECDTLDQLSEVVNEIQRNPSSRRLFVTAWNPSEVDQMCLPPCHTHFQFYVDGNKLSTIFYMRSVDLFLGMPHDIALYALLTHIVANECKLIPYELTGMFGDTHIYLNHIDQCAEQLRRDPKESPRLVLQPMSNIDNFQPSHATLINYEPHPAIKAPMAV